MDGKCYLKIYVKKYDAKASISNIKNILYTISSNKILYDNLYKSNKLSRIHQIKNIKRLYKTLGVGEITLIPKYYTLVRFDSIFIFKFKRIIMEPTSFGILVTSVSNC